MPSGRFVISKTKNEKFFFTLYSSGGRALAKSCEYSCLSVCKKGIASLRINSDAPLDDTTLSIDISALKERPRCPKIELFKQEGEGGSSFGEFNFRIYAKNGTVIATGEGYGTKSSCLEIIEVLRSVAFSAVTE